MRGPLTAAVWREWLHPRGMNGRFIEKLSFVNLFDSNGRGEPRRGRVTDITPEKMSIKMSDGSTEEVATDAISKRVNIAPTSKARLDPEAELPEEVAPEAPVDIAEEAPAPDAAPSHEEALRALTASPELAEWQRKTEEFNASLRENPPQGKSANESGTEPFRKPAVTEISVDQVGASVPDMFEEIRSQLPDAFGQHLAYVSDVIGRAGKAGLNSEDVLMVEGPDGNKVWSPATKDYMNALVDEYIAEFEAQGVPKDRRALMLGGLPGAGKTTLLQDSKHVGVSLNDWAVSNPDEVKERMIRDGLSPKIDGLAPMETAGPMHELSSDIAKMVNEKAMERGFNMALDVTMGGGPKRDGRTGTEKSLDELAAKGYNDVDAMFVQVSLGTSAKSQMTRHLGGLNSWREGERGGGGGRFVPEFILAGSDARGSGERDNLFENTVNWRNFEKMKNDGRFNRWYVVSNDDYDTSPVRIGQGNEEGRVPRFEKNVIVDPVNGRRRVEINLLEDGSVLPGHAEGQPVAAPVPG